MGSHITVITISSEQPTDGLGRWYIICNPSTVEAETEVQSQPTDLGSNIGFWMCSIGSDEPVCSSEKLRYLMLPLVGCEIPHKLFGKDYLLGLWGRLSPSIPG